MHVILCPIMCYSTFSHAHPPSTSSSSDVKSQRLRRLSRPTPFICEFNFRNDLPPGMFVSF